MGDLLTRDVDGDLTLRLKTKAELNRTSLQHEASRSNCIVLAHAESLGDSLITNDRCFVEKLKGTPYARHITALADWQP